MSKEIYGCLDNNVLTFYFDEKKKDRPGEVFSYVKGEVPEWAFLEEANRCVVDPSVKEWKTESLFSFFEGLTNIEKIEGLENIDTSKCESFVACFMSCHNLKSVDLSMWDTGNVWNANFMFASCHKLQDCNLSNWNMRKLQGIANLFEKCYCLKKVDLSTWEYTKKRTTKQKGGLSGMGSENFNKNVRQVNRFLDSSDMFTCCKNLKQVFLPSDLIASIKYYGKEISQDNNNACVIYSDGKKFKTVDNQKLYYLGFPLESSARWVAENTVNESELPRHEIYQGSRNSIGDRA